MFRKVFLLAFIFLCGAAWTALSMPANLIHKTNSQNSGIYIPKKGKIPAKFSKNNIINIIHMQKIVEITDLMPYNMQNGNMAWLYKIKNKTAKTIYKNSLTIEIFEQTAGKGFVKVQDKTLNYDIGAYKTYSQKNHMNEPWCADATGMKIDIKSSKTGTVIASKSCYAAINNVVKKYIKIKDVQFKFLMLRPNFNVKIQNTSAFNFRVAVGAFIYQNGSWKAFAASNIFNTISKPGVTTVSLKYNKKLLTGRIHKVKIILKYVQNIGRCGKWPLIDEKIIQLPSSTLHK